MKTHTQHLMTRFVAFFCDEFLTEILRDSLGILRQPRLVNQSESYKMPRPRASAGEAIRAPTNGLEGVAEGGAAEARAAQLRAGVVSPPLPESVDLRCPTSPGSQSVHGSHAEQGHGPERQWCPTTPCVSKRSGRLEGKF